MQINEELQDLGLSKSEVKVYVYLLEHGLSFTRGIAEGTDISHTNAYNIADKLEDKKIVDEQEKDGKKAYLANSPKSIVRMIERKKEKAEQLVGDLEALYNKREGKPKIKFYDGLEQVKDLLREHYDVEEAYSIGSAKNFWDLDEEYFKERTKVLRENGVIWHDIMPHASKEGIGEDILDTLGGLYDVTFLPEKFGDMSAVFYIWENKVAIVHIDQPVFATVIINKNAADSLRKVIDSFRELVPEKYVYRGNKKSLDERMRSK